MSKATVWNRDSTNYDSNEFVRQRGTDQFEVSSEDEALRLIIECVQNPAIERLELELEIGLITWERNSQPDDCDCGCTGDCSNCQDDLESFLKDLPEDDDMLDDKVA
jgi:hypothetical protein